MTQYINSGTAGPLQAGAHAALTQGESLAGEMRDRCSNGIDLAMSRAVESAGHHAAERPTRAACTCSSH